MKRSLEIGTEINFNWNFLICNDSVEKRANKTEANYIEENQLLKLRKRVQCTGNYWQIHHIMKCNKSTYVLSKCPFFWLYKSNWFVLDGNGFIYIIYDVCIAAPFCSISRQFSSSFCFYNIHFIFQHAINRSFDTLGVSMYAYMSVYVLCCERFFCLWFRSSSVFYVFTLAPSYTRTACYMVTKYGKEDVHSFVHLFGC